MPVYTYRAAEPASGCARCADDFDVVHGMTAPRLETCPDCASPVVRIITGANIVSGHHFGEGLSREKMKRGGLRKLVRDDSGNYVDDTPK